MAPLAQHMSDCLRFLGEPFESVNRWIDECFAMYGPAHRKVRHHREGIEEARDLFGDRGSLAAAIHVLRDCRHIPRKQDYELGYVDALGLKKNWSTAAYIKYSEGDFKSLVEQLLKPSGLVLWSFIESSLVQQLLVSVARLDQKTVGELATNWEKAAKKRASLPPLEPTPSALISYEPPSPEVAAYLKEVKETQLFQVISSSQETSFAVVPLDQLVNPLVYIDYEYLDSIKPELPSTDDLQVTRFALPQTLVSQVKAAADPTQRSIIFVSNEKSLTVSPVQVRQTPNGTEVTFLVAPNFSMLLVTNHSGRLVLRNGIHRAFLLARMGVKVAPCILVNDAGPIPNVQTSSYPAFTSSVLTLPRPPMLIDFFDPDLCLEVPLQRTHKMIRISAEEVMIPID
jgi:hypothetical protein